MSLDPHATPQPGRTGRSRRALLAGGAAAVAAGALGATPARASQSAKGAAAAAPAPAAAAALSTDVHIFYYPWYGSPKVNGSWRHWQQGSLTPPDALSSNFYPKLGAYDSGDRNGAVNQHMTWMRQAGTGVLVTSWWGRGSYEDGLSRLLLDAAGAAGLKVAWHIEPYAGRTAASVADDVRHLDATYGTHPAYYRDAAHGNRNAFYIFESLRIQDWTPIEAVKNLGIVLTQTTDTSKAAHFGGMYTYDGIAAASLPDWSGVDRYCTQNGLLWSPSFGPGYLDDRAVPGNTTPTVERANGTTYDRVWQHTLTSGATGRPPAWVSITSFNEWHEGSQIEPASATPPAALPYQTYNGAYGRTGAAAESAYIERTQYWVQRYVAQRAAN